jgi:hypothetical protein
MSHMGRNVARGGNCNIILPNFPQEFPLISLNKYKRSNFLLYDVENGFVQISAINDRGAG